MKRGIISSLAVLALWGSVGLNFAAAQFGTLGQPPIRPRPTVSPFINMGAGGAGAYYGIVKPQTDATRAILDLQNSQNKQDAMIKAAQDSQGADGLGGAQTGHSATFFNYGHYYPTTPPGGGAPGASPSLGASPGLGGTINPTFTGGVGGPGIRTFFGNNLAVPIIR